MRTIRWLWKVIKSSSLVIIGSDTNNIDEMFVIGEDIFCQTSIEGYCNGPLKPETKYVMKIRAFTATGFQDSPPLKFVTGSGKLRIFQHMEIEQLYWRTCP